MLQNDAQGSVDLGKQLAGIGGQIAQLFLQGAHHRRHERCAHPMAHDIANKDRDRIVGHGYNIVDIATDPTGWVKEAAKLHRTRGL